MKSLWTAYRIMVVIGVAVICCEQPKEGSATKDAVEDITGMTTIKQGNTMKEKLKEIEKAAEKREKELEEIE